MNKKRPDKFKRWMIASLFLIPLVLFGSVAGYYYLHMPVKMNILIYLLGCDRTRPWARKTLFSQGKKAAPYVVKGLWNDNKEVRRWSEAFLAGLDWKGVDKRTRGRLIELLSHPKSMVRARAAFALGCLKEKAAGPRLMELLSDPDVDVRARAASALGTCGGKSVVSVLIKLLSDSEVSVRASAACALGRIGQKRALPHLIKLLSDPEAQARWGAAQALYEMRSDEATAPLIASLKSDPHIKVRYNAALALGRIGSVEAVEPLIACLKEKPMPGAKAQDWHNWHWFQFCVISVLEQITGQSFGKATTGAQGEAVVQKWLKWWEENKEKYEVGGQAQKTEAEDTPSPSGSRK